MGKPTLEQGWEPAEPPAVLQRPFAAALVVTSVLIFMLTLAFTLLPR